jgi:hypothetical protein
MLPHIGGGSRAADDAALTLSRELSGRATRIADAEDQIGDTVVIQKGIQYMKRIVLLVALFTLGLSAASFAVAKPPPGKGKDKSSTSTSTNSDPESCHPKVAVILKGDFVSGGGDSFTMDVKSSNSHGRQYAGKPLTLKVDSKTKFKRNGPAELSDFEAGDRLNVQARACKASKNAPASSNAAPPAMLARRVTGHPAKASGSGDDGGDGSGTTTTTP